jgi:hypothetical protein
MNNNKEDNINNSLDDLCDMIVESLALLFPGSNDISRIFISDASITVMVKPGRFYQVLIVNNAIDIIYVPISMSMQTQQFKREFIARVPLNEPNINPIAEISSILQNDITVRGVESDDDE